ncbi:MAG: hypothetical protein RSC40_04530 [Clostridia bacterium]
MSGLFQTAPQALSLWAMLGGGHAELTQNRRVQLRKSELAPAFFGL